MRHFMSLNGKKRRNKQNRQSANLPLSSLPCLSFKSLLICDLIQSLEVKLLYGFDGMHIMYFLYFVNILISFVLGWTEQASQITWLFLGTSWMWPSWRACIPSLFFTLFNANWFFVCLFDTCDHKKMEHKSFEFPSLFPWLQLISVVTKRGL